MVFYIDGGINDDRSILSYENLIKKVKKLSNIEIGTAIMSVFGKKCDVLQALFISGDKLVLFDDTRFSDKNKLQYYEISKFMGLSLDFIKVYMTLTDGTKIKISTTDVREADCLSEFSNIVNRIKTNNREIEEAKGIKFECGNLYINKDERILQFNNRIIPFKDVLDYQVKINDVKKHRANLTGAVIGGILSGGIGALIGASFGDTTVKYIDSASITIFIEDFSEPYLTLDLVKGTIKKDTSEYKSIEDRINKILAALEIVLKIKNQ